MKCSQLYGILAKDGWHPVSQKGSHMKMRHETKEGTIIFPNHGSQEMGKGLEKKILRACLGICQLFSYVPFYLASRPVCTTHR